MRIRKDIIINAAIIFACIPTILFLTWCKLPVCLAGMGLLGVACYSAIKARGGGI